MKRGTRLSLTLHALVHMADAKDPLTSESIAAMTGSNAAAVRRAFGGLREAGIVAAVKGHGGGWSLARSLDRITLAQIYAAIGEPTLFAIADRTESPGCLVEQAVNRAMGEALAEAERVLAARFTTVTLADIARDVRREGGIHVRRHDHRR